MSSARTLAPTPCLSKTSKIGPLKYDSVRSSINIVAAVPGNRLEKCIQGLGHLLYRSALLTPLIFLIEDQAAKCRAEELYRRLIEGGGEDVGIQVGLIFNVFPATAEFLSTN